MESWWSPHTHHGVNLDFIRSPSGVHQEYQDFIRTPDGVCQDVWLSVTYRFVLCLCASPIIRQEALSPGQKHMGEWATRYSQGQHWQGQWQPVMEEDREDRNREGMGTTTMTLIIQWWYVIAPNLWPTTPSPHPISASWTWHANWCTCCLCEVAGSGKYS